MEDYGLVALVMEKEDNFIDYFNTIQGADLAAGLKSTGWPADQNRFFFVVGIFF